MNRFRFANSGQSFTVKIMKTLTNNLALVLIVPLVGGLVSALAQPRDHRTPLDEPLDLYQDYSQTPSRACGFKPNEIS